MGRGFAPPHSILVRGPNWTGDLVMATPGFRALRVRFPAARITLHVAAGMEPLLAGARWFDDVIPVASRGRGLPSLLREARALRARRFELGICLPDSFSSALLMRVAGVRKVIGYRRGWRSALLHHAVPAPASGGRRMLLARERHVLGLMAAAGAPAAGTHLELFVTSEERAQAFAALQRAGIDAAAPFAALAPGASFGPSKLWPAEAFAALGDGLRARGLQVAVLGTPAEAQLTARVVRGIRRGAADLAGLLSLGSLKAVLEKARVLVCNDAGARHLAVALGVPCVVAMGPTALEKTGMNLARVSILSADVRCRPCYKRHCPIDHRCMRGIPVAAMRDEVLRAVEQGMDFAGRRIELPGPRSGA